MVVISYVTAIAAVIIVWVGLRVYWNYKKDKTDTLYEIKLLGFLFSLLLIMRVSFFHGPVASQSIESIVINFKKLQPQINLVPFAGISFGDFLGKILLFLPYGLTMKLCFGKRAEKIGKVVLWGASLSCGIELFQLLCTNRVTDLNDLIANTLGVLAGIGAYYLILHIIRINKEAAVERAESLKEKETKNEESKSEKDNGTKTEDKEMVSDTKAETVEVEVETDSETMMSISEKLKQMKK